MYIHRFSNEHFLKKELNCVLSSYKGNGKWGSKCHFEHVDSQTAQEISRDAGMVGEKNLWPRNPTFHTIPVQGFESQVL